MIEGNAENVSSPRKELETALKLAEICQSLEKN